MGQRSRRRERDPAPATPPPGRPSSSEQRNERVRAALAPLADGERPPAILAAVALASALGLANLAAYAAGTRIQGKAPGPGVLSFTLVMGIAALGMWRLRYWAVLGFEALLALIVVTFSLFLVRAANVEALLVCLVIIGLCGWLFWKLVRAMARIQIPARRPPP